MKPPTKSLWTSLIGVALLAVSATAQTAQLTADARALSPAGGTLRLIAVVSYTERPAAIGWTITLPSGWKLEKIGGGSPPQIAAAPDSVGDLEFAYVNVPDLLASFELTVRYPASAVRAKISAQMIVRAGGRIETITPTALEFDAP